MPGAMSARLARTIAARLGLATRIDVGRLRSTIAAVATVAREEAGALRDRLDETQAELAAIRAIVDELYLAGADQAARPRG